MRILCIEGMLNMPLVYNQLITPALTTTKKHVEVTRLSWNEQYRGPTVFDIVVGHSLGGKRALNWCQVYKPNLGLITIDPRWMLNTGYFGMLGLGSLENLPDFTEPTGVNTFNFYHKGPWLPGYKVNGAKNLQLYRNHLFMPGDPEVVNCLARLINMN